MRPLRRVRCGPSKGLPDRASDFGRRIADFGDRIANLAGPARGVDLHGAVQLTDYEFIDDKRRSFLLGEVFTSAVVAEILSWQDLLPMHIYLALRAARGARNKWLHELKAVSRLDSEAAFDVIALLMSSLFGIMFELRVGGSSTGFSADEIKARKEALGLGGASDRGAASSQPE